MFPSNPWKDISSDGILNFIFVFTKTQHLILFIALSFVQTLLELDSKKRLLINKVFLQPWLQVEIFVLFSFF
jgi:hypothetical protein